MASYSLIGTGEETSFTNWVLHVCFIPGESGTLSCSPQNFHLKNLVFTASWVFYFELSWETCPPSPRVGLTDTCDVLCEPPAQILAHEAPGLHFTPGGVGGGGDADSPSCSPTRSTLRSDQKTNAWHWVLTFEKVRTRNHETFRREDGGLEANSVTAEQDWAGF